MKEKLVTNRRSSVEDVHPTEVKVYVNPLILLHLNGRGAVEVRNDLALRQAHALLREKPKATLEHEHVVYLTAYEARAFVTVSRASQTIIPSVRYEIESTVRPPNEYVRHRISVQLFLSVGSECFLPSLTIPLYEVVVAGDPLLTGDTHELVLCAMLRQVFEVRDHGGHVRTVGTRGTVEAHDVELTVTGKLTHSVMRMGACAVRDRPRLTAYRRGSSHSSSQRRDNVLDRVQYSRIALVGRRIVTSSSRCGVSRSCYRGDRHLVSRLGSYGCKLRSRGGTCGPVRDTGVVNTLNRRRRGVPLGSR